MQRWRDADRRDTPAGKPTHPALRRSPVSLPLGTCRRARSTLGPIQVDVLGYFLSRALRYEPFEPWGCRHRQHQQQECLARLVCFCTARPPHNRTVKRSPTPQTHPCHPQAPSRCFDPLSTASDLYLSVARHICTNIMPPCHMTFVNATFTCRSLPLPHPNHPYLLAIHPSSVTIAPKLCRYGQLPHCWPLRWDSRCWLRCRLPAR